MYPEEAEQLGIKPLPNEKGRNNAKYRISVIQNEQLRSLRGHGPIKRLFFDIETSPCIGYFWRPGYNINLTYENIIEPWRIICISYKWEGRDKVHRITWDKNQCDKSLLEKFIPIANKADEIVAHNGDRFDIKKLRTRSIYHRVPMFPKYRSLDTLKKSRSGFSFPSNRLNDIGQFLGVGQKLETGGFSLWKDVMNGNKKALKQMGDYCDQDVVLLEDVFTVLKDYTINNTHVGVIQGGWKYECPNCGNQDAVLYKNNFTAKGTIKRLMECDRCEYHYEISNSDYRRMLELKSNAV